MNRISLAALFLSVTIIPSMAQEEGPAVARSRFDKPNSITIGGGGLSLPSVLGNLNAWAGWTASEYVTNKSYAILTETVWTKWLSTQFNVLYNDYLSDRANGGIANLSAPLLNGNPLNEWANGATLSDVEQPTRRWAARGAAMLTHSLFRDRVQSQTLLGYDIEWADSGPTDYGYFLADSNFNVVYDPRIPSNLGRTPMPRIATIPVWIVLIWSLLDFVTPVLP